MGLNIGVYNRNGEPHPAWDSARLPGDRELSNVITTWNDDDSKIDWDEFCTEYRPPINADLPGERGQCLLNILKDPQWHVELSW